MVQEVVTCEHNTRHYGLTADQISAVKKPYKYYIHDKSLSCEL